MPTLNWRGEWPAEVRAAVEPHLQRWLGIVPGWCAEIIVRWNGDETTVSMQTSVRPEYRDTILEVCPGWLEMDEASRELTVVHELVHIINGPLVNFTQGTIHDLSEQGSQLRAVLDRQAVTALEGMVEDQARAFVALRAADG